MDQPLAERNLSLGFFLPGFAILVVLLVLLSPVPSEVAAEALLAFAGLALCSLLGDHLGFRFPPFRPVLRPLWAILLLSLAYSALGKVIPWVAPEDQEWQLLALDRQWFAYTWEAWWQTWQHPLLTDFLQAIYTSFYLFPLLFLGWLIYRRDEGAQVAYLDRVVLGFLLSYCGYLCMAARSPYEFLEYSAVLSSFGLRDFLHNNVALASFTKRDCFPSGHTMMSFYIAWLAWQRAPRSLFLFGPWALLTVLATLYLRYHFLVDVIAGLLCFLIWVFLSERLFGRFREIPRAAPLE